MANPLAQGDARSRYPPGHPHSVPGMSRRPIDAPVTALDPPPPSRGSDPLHRVDPRAFHWRAKGEFLVLQCGNKSERGRRRAGAQRPSQRGPLPPAGGGRRATRITIEGEFLSWLDYTIRVSDRGPCSADETPTKLCRDEASAGGRWGDVVCIKVGGPHPLPSIISHRYRPTAQDMRVLVSIPETSTTLHRGRSLENLTQFERTTGLGDGRE